jgi:hypothetical protein
MIKTSYKSEIAYDDQDRIVNIKSTKAIGLPNHGHSVCNICGKDMPSVWDTVCIKCGGTHCYKHSVTYNNYWYCWKCIASIIRQESR